MVKKAKRTSIKGHGFPPVIDQYSELLILGSYPSKVSRNEAFFYMHPTNRFWPMLSVLLNIDLVSLSIEERITVLKKRHIALYDVIESCSIIGSSDASIKDVIPATITKYIEDTKIKHIFLNGKTAYRLFIKYHPKLQSMAKELPSTSAANAKWSLEDLICAWQAAFDKLQL